MILVEGTFTGLAGSEVELFQKLVGNLSGEAVEIGSLDGFSAAVILECSDLRLTAIDPFIPDSIAANLVGSQDRFWKNVDPWRSRVTLRADYSWNVSPQWTTALDFLFIDGDHTYQNCRRDFDEWSKFVKPGGMLAMHDSRMQRPGGARFHEGPSRVAMECLYGCPDEWEIIGEAFSLTVARRK
jgi:predicted O-methyltransferase YrrM